MFSNITNRQVYGERNNEERVKEKLPLKEKTFAAGE